VSRAMTRATFAVAATLLAITATGCPSDPREDDVILYSITTAPPASKGTVSNLEPDDYTITLSRGVALAARCWDTCTSTCEAAQITVDDTTRLGVRPLWRPGGSGGEVVLVAGEVGTTALHVTTPCATRTYRVQVIER